MTLQLNLPAELHDRLRQEAERRKEPVETVAVHLLDEHLPPTLDARRAAALAMLKQWMEEDAGLTPEEEMANEEFFRSLDAARTSNRPRFPPELKGITW